LESLSESRKERGKEKKKENENGERPSNLGLRILMTSTEIGESLRFAFYFRFFLEGGGEKGKEGVLHRTIEA